MLLAAEGAVTTRLPVVGSTAASTAFCTATLEGPGGLRLHFDGNGKVTAGNGSLHEPKPNALSLVQIETCPQSTPTCRATCYVHNLEKAQQQIHDLYKENTQTMHVILGDADLAEQWCMHVAKWIRENAPHGFRWHVSGDVMSMVHAEWIRDVALEAGTPSWIYTRSFDYLAPLVQACTLRGGPLAVNLSCDRDNYAAAQRASEWATASLSSDDQYLRLCYLVVEGDTPPSDLMADDVIFPDYSLRPRQFATLAESPWWQSIPQFQRGLVCPVDAHGKAENRRCGPCQRCLQ